MLRIFVGIEFSLQGLHVAQAQRASGQLVLRVGSREMPFAESLNSLPQGESTGNFQPKAAICEKVYIAARHSKTCVQLGRKLDAQ